MERIRFGERNERWRVLKISQCPITLSYVKQKYLGRGFFNNSKGKRVRIHEGYIFVLSPQFLSFNTTRNRWKRYICSQQFFHSIRLSLDSQFVSSSPPHLARPVPSPTPSATRPSEWGGRIRRESTRSISINDRKNSSRYIPSLDRPEWRAQPGHALWNLLTVFYPLPSYYFRFKRCQPCRRFEERTRKRVQGVNSVIYRCSWPMEREWTRGNTVQGNVL